MVNHVNPFANVGGPGGVAKAVYKAWGDQGALLAKQRKTLETWGWIFFLVGFVATLEQMTRVYAPLGFIIGGLLVYRAKTIRIEEGTIEGVLQRWDFDANIKYLIAQEQDESERRSYELRRPATDAELLRRSEIIRNLDGKI